MEDKNQNQFKIYYQEGLRFEEFYQAQEIRRSDEYQEIDQYLNRDSVAVKIVKLKETKQILQMINI